MYLYTGHYLKLCIYIPGTTSSYVSIYRALPQAMYLYQALLQAFNLHICLSTRHYLKSDLYLASTIEHCRYFHVPVGNLPKVTLKPSIYLSFVYLSIYISIFSVNFPNISRIYLSTLPVAKLANEILFILDKFKGIFSMVIHQFPNSFFLPESTSR